jgi:hypothetical protein
LGDEGSGSALNLGRQLPNALSGILCLSEIELARIDEVRREMA